MTLLRVDNPKEDIFVEWNVLEKEVTRFSNSIQVFDRTAPPPNGYLIIGNPYQQGTEVARPVTTNDFAVKQSGTIMLGNTLRQNHLQGTKIYWTPYADMIVEKSTDEKLWENLGTYEIEYDKPQTTVFDNTATFYRSKFINLQTQSQTDFKDAHTDGVYGFKAGRDNYTTMEEMFRELNMNVFGKAVSNVENSVWLLYLNYSQFEISEVIAKEDRDFFHNIINYKVNKDVRNYKLPDLFHLLSDVRINGCTIPRITMVRDRQSCTDCKKEEAPVDICTCPAVAPECDTEKKCLYKPPYYYSLTEKDIILHPTPYEDAIMTIGYSGIPEPFTMESVGLRLPNGYREVLVAGALYKYYFYNKKNAEDQQYASNLLATFRMLLERLRGIVLDRLRARTVENQQVVLGNRARPYNSNSFIKKQFNSNQELVDWTSFYYGFINF